MAGIVKAVALIAGEPNVRGSIQFSQNSSGATHILGRITGLSPGLHGFHIHALGDTTNGCNSTGPHFNPFKKDHGSPIDKERHAGDLGNIYAGSDGVAEFSISDTQIPLTGPHSIPGEGSRCACRSRMILEKVDMNLARQLGMLVQELVVVIIPSKN